MAKATGDSIKQSEPQQVSSYIKDVQHPLKEVMEALRKIILNAGPEIGEEIKWNAPAFFYTGQMAPFNPKEYKRHIVVFNLHQHDCVRLVFPSGAKVNDESGLLQGSYADGRKLAMFYNFEDVKQKENNLITVIKRWLEQVEK